MKAEVRKKLTAIALKKQTFNLLAHLVQILDKFLLNCIYYINVEVPESLILILFYLVLSNYIYFKCSKLQQIFRM